MTGEVEIDAVLSTLTVLSHRAPPAMRSNHAARLRRNTVLNEEKETIKRGSIISALADRQRH